MSRDTPVTPCTRPPVFHRSLPQSIISAKPRNSTNFHYKANSTPNLSTYSTTPVLCLFRACSPSNQVNNINPSLLSLTFFPYITSWLYHTVYIHSLIISALLHIIVTRTHSVTLCFFFKVFLTSFLYLYIISCL